MAADFSAAITAGFRVLYVFVVMEVGSRRILHCNVTAQPSAAWTLQRFREAMASDHAYRFLIHMIGIRSFRQLLRSVCGAGIVPAARIACGPSLPGETNFLSVVATPLRL
ncbi:MAG TPA: hypothetical protein VJX16_23105 [Terriglobales bacterium]|nr:hypothetical protein [Terriglobales bacterium]